MTWYILLFLIKQFVSYNCNLYFLKTYKKEMSEKQVLINTAFNTVHVILNHHHLFEMIGTFNLNNCSYVEMYLNVYEWIRDHGSISYSTRFSNKESVDKWSSTVCCWLHLLYITDNILQTSDGATLERKEPCLAEMSFSLYTDLSLFRNNVRRVKVSIYLPLILNWVSYMLQRMFPKLFLSCCSKSCWRHFHQKITFHKLILWDCFSLFKVLT